MSLILFLLVFYLCDVGCAWRLHPTWCWGLQSPSFNCGLICPALTRHPAATLVQLPVSTLSLPVSGLRSPEPKRPPGFWVVGARAPWNCFSAPPGNLVIGTPLYSEEAGRALRSAQEVGTQMEAFKGPRGLQGTVHAAAQCTWLNKDPKLQATQPILPLLTDLTPLLPVETTRLTFPRPMLRVGTVPRPAAVPSTGVARRDGDVPSWGQGSRRHGWRNWGTGRHG